MIIFMGLLTNHLWSQASTLLFTCSFIGFVQLKKDKVELENQLEQEQEALVNRLWKRMDKLEAEKR